jgi:hypothetical protein
MEFSEGTGKADKDRKADRLEPVGLRENRYRNKNIKKGATPPPFLTLIPPSLSLYGSQILLSKLLEVLRCY